MREAKNSNRENDISNIVLLNNNIHTMLCLNFCIVLLLLLNVNFPLQTLHGFWAPLCLPPPLLSVAQRFSNSIVLNINAPPSLCMKYEMRACLPPPREMTGHHLPFLTSRCRSQVDCCKWVQDYAVCRFELKSPPVSSRCICVFIYSQFCALWWKEAALDTRLRQWRNKVRPVSVAGGVFIFYPMQK